MTLAFWLNDVGIHDLEQLKVGMFIKAKGQDGNFMRVEVLELVGGQDMPVKVRERVEAREATKKRKSHKTSKAEMDKLKDAGSPEAKRRDSGSLEGKRRSAPKVEPEKPKEFWLKLDDCRLIRDISVDWDDFEDKLPSGQDHESREKRKEVFKAWSTGRKKFLTLEQLQSGVREVFAKDIGADVEETDYCVKAAWKAARSLALPSKRQKAAKTVCLKQFHAFIVALRYYIELAELFEHLDTNQEDDQRLSLRECRRGLGSLEAWGITEEKLAEKFKGVDPWTPMINFQDFAEWLVEERWSSIYSDMDMDSSDDEVQFADAGATLRTIAGIEKQDKRYGQECLQNRKKVTEIFKKADSNRSGMISEDELVAVFRELNSNITPEVAHKLFSLADANKDGQVDYEEFCLWLFR